MEALEIVQRLVSFDSTSLVTNQPVSDQVQDFLRRCEFEVERIEYGTPEIRKVCLVAKKGTGRAGLAYLGHSDVVPADDWMRTPGPFAPFVEGNRLFGRGSCDMKGSLAAMLSAASRFSASRLRKPLYYVCTADEEIGYLGAREVVQRSTIYREMVREQVAGIVGEPTRLEVVYAHKGTYGFRVVSHGRAAHSSTREGKNANLAMIPFLQEMKNLYELTESDPQWRNGEFDPPTVSWNIGINDHTRAINITAAQSICTVYFRPMPGQDAESLMTQSRESAEALGLEFQVLHRAPPMYADRDSAFVRRMLDMTGNSEAKTVSYGTDGCMYSELNKLVVYGPGDIAQAHTADEWIDLDQLQKGSEMYQQLIEYWCC